MVLVPCGCRWSQGRGFGQRLYQDCRIAADPKGVERVQYPFLPRLGGGSVVHVAVHALQNAPGAKCMQAAIKVATGLAEVGMGVVAQGEDGIT